MKCQSAFEGNQPAETVFICALPYPVTQLLLYKYSLIIGLMWYVICRKVGCKIDVLRVIKDSSFLLPQAGSDEGTTIEILAAYQTLRRRKTYFYVTCQSIKRGFFKTGLPLQYFFIYTFSARARISVIEI